MTHRFQTQIRTRLSLLLTCFLLALPLRAQQTTVAFTEYPVPSSVSSPYQIVTGPDAALWFVENGGNRIGRITSAGAITEYPVPTPNAQLNGITAGPDGALWFTERGSSKIGRITTNGVITEYPLTNPYAAPVSITPGPDSALWFTESGGGGSIGRITTNGTITEYPAQIPGDFSSFPGVIIAGPDGALWFTETVYNPSVRRMTTTGVITASYPAAVSSSLGLDVAGTMVVGPDGALWFTDFFSNRIGRLTTAGAITEYPLSSSLAGPLGIAAGPDGALWFAEGGSPYDETHQIGRITTSGVITEYAIPTKYAAVHGMTAGPDSALWFTEDIGILGQNGGGPTAKIGRAAIPVPQTTFTISGRVTDSGGNGIEAANLTLTGTVTTTTSTAQDGTYQFTNLAAGNYTITPSRTGFTFTPAQTSFNSLNSNQTASFSGQLTNAPVITFHFPEIANGTSGNIVWKTTILLTNSAAIAATGTIAFRHDDGSAFNLTITDQDGQTTTGSTIMFSMGAGQVRAYVSSGAGPFDAGFATVTTTGSVSGTAIFSESDVAGGLISAAGVPGAAAAPRQAVFVYTADGYTTGIACANPGTTAANITFSLLNSAGTTIATSTQVLGPNSHSAKFVFDIFPGFTGQLAGTLQVSSSTPLAIIALRFDRTRTIFNTLPPVTLAPLVVPK